MVVNAIELLSLLLFLIVAKPGAPRIHHASKIIFPSSIPSNYTHPPRTMPSNRFLNHLTVSAWLMRCDAPILLVARRLLATRAPGRVLFPKNVSSRLPTPSSYSQRPYTSSLNYISPPPLIFLAKDSHATIEIHPVNPNRRIILDP